LFTGHGIRKTNQYESRLSKGEWLAKKEEFWGTINIFPIETRIEGRPECWYAVKGACETDDCKLKYFNLENAIAILAAAELKLVQRSI